MSDLFKYEENEIRTVEIAGKRWAVAADICRILELTQSDKVVARLDEADRISTTVRSGGQNRKMWVVSEDGATDLVLDSRKPEARKFRRFLTHEVWPAVRDTGSYGTPTPPDFTALDPNSLAFIEQLGKGMQLAIESAKKNQSKADAFDTFLNGKGCYLIDTVANLIGAKHKALWSFLFAEKILIEKGPRRREPYAKAKFDGWFSVKTHDQDKTNGHASRTTYVTPLGMEGIRLLAIERGLIEPQLMVLPSSPIKELSS